MDFHSKFLKFWITLDLIDVYQYHIPKKIHPRIPSTTLVLKYIFKFSNSMIGIILSQIYSICSKSSMCIEFFKIID
jgi:hypothetical protein